MSDKKVSNINIGGEKDQEEVNEFIEALVLAVTGFYVKEIPEEKRDEIISDCIDLFTKFILEYVEVTFGKKDALRLKAGYETGEDVFSRFSDLKEKYENAYNAFVKMLEENIEKDKEKTK